MVLRDSKCYFVEVKRPGEELRPLQKAVHKIFKKLGFNVYVIDNLEDVDRFIAEVILK